MAADVLMSCFRRAHTPEDVGDREDDWLLVPATFELGGPDVGDDGAVTLHPDVTSTFHQHPVLTTD